MVAKEAIYWLVNIEKKYIHGGDEYYDNQRKKALELAQDALYLQVPRIPIGDLHSVPHYRCPTCSCSVVLYKDDYRNPHCQWCGQLLDWND